MAIEKHKTVSIEYEVKSDGEVIDSNIGQKPLIFTFGTGEVIPGLEKRMAHMDIGDSEVIFVPAEEAYGPYLPDGTQSVPRDQLEGINEQHVGQPLEGEGPDGKPYHVIIKEVRDDVVIVDFNHPMAGKDLEFSLKILNII
jgi:FKBP-type peptidyl-prolyl cis-trans isomerase SlyD